MPTNPPVDHAHISVYASLADIRSFIIDHYATVGGLSALIELNKIEARILGAIELEVQ